MSGTTVHTLENQQLLEQVERESATAARQLAETAHLREGTARGHRMQYQ